MVKKIIALLRMGLVFFVGVTTVAVSEKPTTLADIIKESKTKESKAATPSSVSKVSHYGSAISVTTVPDNAKPSKEVASGGKTLAAASSVPVAPVHDNTALSSSVKSASSAAVPSTTTLPSSSAPSPAVASSTPATVSSSASPSAATPATSTTATSSASSSSTTASSSVASSDTSGSSATTSSDASSDTDSDSSSTSSSDDSDSDSGSLPSELTSPIGSPFPSATSTQKAAASVTTTAHSAASTVHPFAQKGSLTTHSISVQHAKMDDAFKHQVEAVWNKLPKRDEEVMLMQPEFGKISFLGQAENIVKISRLVHELDKPIEQVRIDSIILFAERTYTFDWGFDYSGIYDRSATLSANNTPFSLSGIGGSLGSTTNQVNMTGTAGAESSSPLFYAVNLFNKFWSFDSSSGGGDAFVQIPFVFGGSDLSKRRFNLILNMAETEKKVKIISRPSILTKSGEAASVYIGQELPLQESTVNSSTGTTYKGNKVSYEKIGINLQVTPKVQQGGEVVSLKINVVDRQQISGSTTSNADGIMLSPPVLSTVKVQNEVTLRSGQTTVIGGLAKKETRKTKGRIPWLYKLPIIGPLFFESTFDSKVELEQFIFITATVIKQTA